MCPDNLNSSPSYPMLLCFTIFKVLFVLRWRIFVPLEWGSHYYLYAVVNNNNVIGCALIITMYCLQPPVVPRDDVMVTLTTNLVQAVLQLKNRFKGATAEDYMEFVKVS